MIYNDINTLRHVTISDDIRKASNGFRLVFIHFDLIDIDTTKVEIELKNAELYVKNNFNNNSIKQRHPILETRNVYKKLGKDPNRYRPSAEQLSRRVISKGSVYRVNALVDIGNVISLNTGFSVGVFDSVNIIGDIILSKGTKDDVFRGIGRGLINVENLPLYKDSLGGFATPTTDEERTKILLESKKIFIFINEFGYDNNSDELSQAIDFTKELISKCCNTSNFGYFISK